ncbi:MAG: hypothetical protein JXB49_14130 [Bacteroidales bacterium]|nr:hypothetical protein [Bacteroidales bacterium]
MTKQNSTTFIRCPKDEQHPFNRLPASLFSLNGYQLAIMAQILSNCDNWNLVKYEIGKRLGFPREKFNKAWRSLEDLGYIKKTQIQSGWEYIITEDLDFTPTTYGNCQSSTLTTGRKCKGGTLTTTKKNYNYITNETTCTDATCLKSKFDELNELYPVSVSSYGGQTNFLKANLEDCEREYTEYLMSQQTSHEEIISCLKKELDERNHTGQAYYQPSLLKWIKDKRWTAYEHKIREHTEERYGETLE